MPFRTGSNGTGMESAASGPGLTVDASRVRRRKRNENLIIPICILDVLYPTYPWSESIWSSPFWSPVYMSVIPLHNLPAFKTLIIYL